MGTQEELPTPTLGGRTERVAVPTLHGHRLSNV
ncbi:hypothetical protein Cadr_000031371, partial [Camelus dromedarius]